MALSPCTCPPGGLAHDCERHGVVRERTPKSNGRARLPRSSVKQARLDGIWEGLRAMYIWIARHHDLEDQMFRCEECGRFAPPKNYGYGSSLYGECDHVIPRSKSGHYSPNNMAWLCAGPDSCHETKHGQPWPEKARARREATA